MSATSHGEAGPTMTDARLESSLVSLFLSRARDLGDAPFLVAKSDKEWHPISWTDAMRQVAAVAGSLRRMGLRPGDRVMLVSENRPEWCIADLAIMAAGCVTVPTYTTNMVKDHDHILRDSGARCVIVSGQKLAERLLPAISASDVVDHIIMFDDIIRPRAASFRLHHWPELAEPEEGDLAALEESAARLERGEMACIIYTSGTGGAPRGVMTSHGAILHNVAGAGDILKQDFAADGRERFLSFLPLSHAYEHTGGQFLPIALGAEIYYAEGLDKLAANIEETSPTVMIVVPRLFEVLRARILRTAASQGGAAKRLLDLAVSLGEREAKGRKRLLDPMKKTIVEQLLAPKIRQKFGGRMKAMVSGGAPLNPEVSRFFGSLGLMILQGYGQTECGPVISCNRPLTGVKAETVGPPLAATGVRIAEDGELLVKGELVMLGYWRNAEETARAIKDGWVHTGDVGHIDEAGRIVITDRKKDIIVNDKGDNVAPQRIEGRLTLEPEIAQAMVYGDARPYVSALIVPDEQWLADWAAEKGRPADLSSLSSDSDFRAAVAEAVARVNADLSVVEKVRNFVFAEEAFAIENGELTPSMKIRRHKINERYEKRLADLYHR